MKKTLFILILICRLSVEAKPNTEDFTDAETNFKLVMQKLQDHYVDKNISKDSLYRAATAGMLSALNPSNEQAWNKLLSPEDLKFMEEELSGKVSGIGISLKFDESTGYGIVLKAISGLPAEKAGIRTDDQILSVDGQIFKGKKFTDLVFSMRGESGKFVDLKVLRGDKILSLHLQRQIFPWKPVEYDLLGDSTALLTIGFFNNETAKLVEKALHEINKNGIHKLVVDVRGNEGGAFDEVLKVAGLFLPENAVIAKTQERGSPVEEHRAHKGLLQKDMHIVLLTNKETFCGAELFVAALKENLNVKTVGASTFGKWNVQSVEPLPNHFAIKYTVKNFQSPQGHTFQDVGIKPDLEIIPPKDVDVAAIRSKYDVLKRLDLDTQLKVAVELVKSI